MFGLAMRHLFGRWGDGKQASTEQQTDYQGLDDSPATLEAEYQRLIAQQLARWGIRNGLVSVEIHQTMRRKARPAFSAVLRINAWERDAALRVLIGLPLLEKKIAKAVATLWIADVSTFEGLMVKVAAPLQEAKPCAELRQLLVTLTGPEHQRVKARTGDDDDEATLA